MEYEESTPYKIIPRMLQKKTHVTFTHCVIFWRAKKKNENLHVMREKGCITIQSGYTFIQFYTYYTHPHTNGVNLQLHFIHTQSILLCLCASILKEKEIIFEGRPGENSNISPTSPLTRMCGKGRFSRCYIAKFITRNHLCVMMKRLKII